MDGTRLGAEHAHGREHRKEAGNFQMENGWGRNTCAALCHQLADVNDKAVCACMTMTNPLTAEAQMSGIHQAEIDVETIRMAGTPSTAPRLRGKRFGSMPMPPRLDWTVPRSRFGSRRAARRTTGAQNRVAHDN
jgi:hypothetical protein